MTHKKKQKNLNLMVGLSAAALVGLPASAAEAQTLNCPQPLIYGSYTVICPGAGTSRVNADGTRSTTGCLTAGGAPFSNANCSVSQSFPFQNMQISVPSNINITRTLGTETIPVTDFNLVTNGGGNVFSTSAPFVNVPIGALLNAAGPVVSGDYSGNFTVNAVFN